MAVVWLYSGVFLMRRAAPMPSKRSAKFMKTKSKKRLSIAFTAAGLCGALSQMSNSARFIWITHLVCDVSFSNYPEGAHSCAVPLRQVWAMSSLLSVVRICSIPNA